MAQKNETPVLILSLLVTLVLLGGGAWWLASRLNLGNVFSGGVNLPGTNSQTSRIPMQERLSTGQQLLLPEASAQKQAGVEAIAAGNFDQAVIELEAALQNDRNDPEALIYLNNAQIGDRTAHTIAVAVPARTAANSALEILRGVAQAQTELNQAGGINGVPLKVLIASDDNEPVTASQVAETLVADDAVLGVVGHFGSEATIAAGEVYQQGGLVMISPTSTSIALSELGDYIFRTVPSDRFTAAALSRYMVNTLQQQSAVIYFNSGSDYSNSLKDEFTTAVYGDGGQIIAEFDLASPTFNASSTLEQANQQDAEVIVLLTNTATLDQALQVVTVNRQQLQLMGGDSVYSAKTLQVGGDAAVGMVVAVPWDIQSNLQSEFVQDSRQLWGGDVSWRTAMAYDAATTLIAGLERNPSRQGLQQTVSAPNFSVEGATGTIRFLPSGDRNQAAQLVEVQSGSRTGYGFDFVPAR
jgi:branched-chain amino acid transport system substrate-binding protein